MRFGFDETFDNDRRQSLFTLWRGKNNRNHRGNRRKAGEEKQEKEDETRQKSRRPPSTYCDNSHTPDATAILALFYLGLIIDNKGPITIINFYSAEENLQSCHTYTTSVIEEQKNILPIPKLTLHPTLPNTLNCLNLPIWHYYYFQSTFQASSLPW